MTDQENEPLDEVPNEDQSTEKSTEPRAPWEVAHAGSAQQNEPGARPSSHAPHFAAAGKLDVLTKIGDLRKEMDRLYHERDEAVARAHELAELLANVRTQAESLDQERTSLKSERDEHVERISSLSNTHASELAEMLADSRKRGEAFDQERAAAREERTELLAQVTELKARARKAEAERDELAQQFRDAMETIDEVDEALDWRKPAPPDSTPSGSTDE